MAIVYWRTKTGAGSMGSGTESVPYSAHQLAEAIRTGVVVPGDTTMLMGEHGPINLADTADFPAHTQAADEPLFISGAGTAIPASNAANSGNYGRNIVFGTTADDGIGTASKASGISFLARGGSKASPNVDMRYTARGGGGGVTTNAERQMAAIILQGYDFPLVDGFFIRCGDWNYAASGRVGPEAAGGESNRPTETSFENLGFMARGAWGSEFSNIYAHGGDCSHTGVMIGWRSYNTDPSVHANKGIYVHDVEAESCGVDQVAIEPGRQIHAGSTRLMPTGAWILVEDVSAHDAYFYMAGYDNQALRFANLFAINEIRAVLGNRVIVRRVTAYGDCQDAILTLGVNLRGEYLHAYDTCPTWSIGDTINIATNSGMGWGGTTSTVAGVGIKNGLSGYEGTPPTTWLGNGTPGGTYSTDALRNAILYSRVSNTTSAGIVSNGGVGMLYHANEIDTPGVEALLLTGRAGNASPYWVSHNYLNGRRGLLCEAYNIALAYNNILVGSTNASSKTGTASAIRGANNLYSGSLNGTHDWVGAINAVPDYTVGVGPDAAGNCLSAGSWEGVMGARFAGVMRDMTGRRWRGPLVIGPRQR